jgi:polyisoprenoid-binding protein YceI
MKRSLVFVVAGLLSILSSVSMAADYTLDTAHTQIKFGVSHMGFSTTRGSFRDFSGNFSFDPEAPEASSAEVVIQTASLDVDDEEWNGHLTAGDWFNVGEFPTMTFTSTSIESTGDGTMNINGELTMLGVTRPVTLNTTLNKIGEQMGKAKSGFSATTTIDRTQWGLDTFAPVIGAEVSISIELEAFQED